MTTELFHLTYRALPIQIHTNDLSVPLLFLPIVLFVQACGLAAFGELLLVTCSISVFCFFLVETPFYLQSVYFHSANWCEDWV
jgi:ATP/ADP translocase